MTRFNLLLSAAAVSATGNPKIANVIKMLDDMKNTCQTEINDQEKAWVRFKQWCDDTNRNKVDEIEKTKVDLDEARAGSLARDEAIGRASALLNEADTDSRTAADDMQAMLRQREVANGKYKEKKNELTQSIEACEEAVDLLSKVPDTATAAVAQTGSSFVQMQTGMKSLMSTLEGKKGSRFTAVRELVQMSMDQPSKKTPQGNNYAIQKSSGAILQMIEDLRDSLEDELKDTEQTESKDTENYALEKQATENTKRNADDMVEEKTRDIAQNEGEKSSFDADVQTFKKSLADAKDYRNKLDNECSVKAKDYIRSAKGRQDELDAIDTAVEILSGAAVSTAGKVLSPPNPGESFLQLSGVNSDSKKKLVELLRQRGMKIGSKALMQLAQAAEADPFGKIKKLIGDLITQLSQERMDEIAKANTCDKDLAASKRKIEKATNEVQKLNTDQESLTSKFETKSREIDEKSEFLQNSDKAYAELQKVRAEEAAANSKAIEESTEGADAVAAAVAVLQEYYDKASGGAAFIQNDFPLNSDFEPVKQYGGSSASEGILSLLTQIETDMRTLIVETESAEKNAKEEFVEEERKLKIATASAKADLNTYKGQLSQMQQDLVETKENLEQSQDLLKKESEYKRVNLDAKCIETGVSYEDRNAKRQEEIVSLQDALKILQQVAP